MKFKKRLIPVLALLLCAMMVFASCGSEPKAIKIDEEKLKTSQMMTNFQIKEIFSEEGYEYNMSSDYLTLFVKNDVANAQAIYKVVNVKTATVVAEMTVSAEESLNDSKSISICNGFIVKYENKTYTLCKDDGTVVGSAKTAPEFDGYYVLIGETALRLNMYTGEIQDTFTYSKLDGTFPSYAKLYGDYCITISSTGFTVYDKNLNYLGEYTFPVFEDSNTQAYPLKNGNVLVQTKTHLPYDAEDYDYFRDGDKFKLETKIVSPKDLKEKVIDFDYCILYASAMDHTGFEWMNFYKDDIDNFAYANKIVGDQLDETDVSLTLTNSGKVDKIVAEGYDQIASLGNGYLYGKTRTDTAVILDAKFNVLFRCNSVEKYTEKYLVTDEAIYGYSKNKLADLVQESITYEFVMTVGNNIIFAAEDEDENYDYYLFDGTFKKIADHSEKQYFVPLKNSTDKSEYFYAVKTEGESATTTVIYKADGTALQSFDKAVDIVRINQNYYDGSETIRIKSDGKFYCITATK